MRWVFFCLLILNVVYMVWGLAVRVAPVHSTATATTYQTHGKQLVLLSEAGVSEGYQLPAVDGAYSLCTTLGPWKDRMEAEKALSGLVRKGYQGRTRPVVVSKDRLHWVFLPAYPDREAAMRVLRELQRRGVDSFIVSDGEDANAISLGYFSSPESARGLMVKMKTSGYPAQTRETLRQETEYWVYLDADGVPDGGEAVRGLLAANPALAGKNAQCAPSLSAPVPGPEVAPAG